MQSTMNQDEFLSTTIDPGGTPFEEKMPLIPEWEGQAQVVDINGRIVEFDNQKTQLITVMWEPMDPALKESMGMDRIRAQQTLRIEPPAGWDERSFAIDLSPTGKKKNFQVGRFLAGFGVNLGSRFQWSQFVHQTAYIKVAPPRRDDALFSTVIGVSTTKEGLSTKKAA